jgi:hypothetical protein
MTKYNSTKATRIMQELPKYERDIRLGNIQKGVVAKILGCSVPTLNKALDSANMRGNPLLSNAAFEFEFTKYESKLANYEMTINDVAKAIGCSFHRVKDRASSVKRVEQVKEVPKPVMCTANRLVSMRW